MFQQIRLMNPRKQISPNPMLFIGEDNLLSLSGIFPTRFKVLLGDITRVSWCGLILGHKLHLSVICILAVDDIASMPKDIITTESERQEFDKESPIIAFPAR